jgi:formylglycine-generating enzyme required for sulfatase activity
MLAVNGFKAALRRPVHEGGLTVRFHFSGVLGLVAMSAALPVDAAEPPKELASKTCGLTLVLIPAGEYLMGSPDSDRDARDDEKPRHRVRISRPFFLGKFEVTQEEFQKVTDRNPSEFSAAGSGKEFVAGQDTRRHPVEKITWGDAVAFCNRLSVRDGLRPYYSENGATVLGGDGYRLPTEAEWEYACRAGTTTRYQSGDDPETLAKVGNVADGTLHARIPELSNAMIAAEDGYVYTAPAGRFAANGFGLHDMHGNVAEWCGDQYAERYYSQSPEADPKGPSPAGSPIPVAGQVTVKPAPADESDAPSPERVFRGGSAMGTLATSRSASRRSAGLHYRVGVIGFRVARGLP